MERNPTAKGGFWMMVEDLNAEPIKEANEIEIEKKAEEDEFYPDASI